MGSDCGPPRRSLTSIGVSIHLFVEQVCRIIEKKALLKDQRTGGAQMEQLQCSQLPAKLKLFNELVNTAQGPRWTRFKISNKVIGEGGQFKVYKYDFLAWQFFISSHHTIYEHQNDISKSLSHFSEHLRGAKACSDLTLVPKFFYSQSKFPLSIASDPTFVDKTS